LFWHLQHPLQTCGNTSRSSNTTQLRTFSGLGGIKANNYNLKNICLNSEDSLAYLNWVDKFAVPLEQIKKNSLRKIKLDL